MRSNEFYKNGFLIAGIYDLILGVSFFIFYKIIFDSFSVVLPENIAYIHLSAAFVTVQGYMYYLVSQNLDSNEDMVKAGVAYKAAYIALVFYYWTINSLPHPMFALFSLFDTGFLIFFLYFLKDRKSLSIGA